MGRVTASRRRELALWRRPGGKEVVRGRQGKSGPGTRGDREAPPRPAAAALGVSSSRWPHPDSRGDRALPAALTSPRPSKPEACRRAIARAPDGRNHCRARGAAEAPGTASPTPQSAPTTKPRPSSAPNSTSPAFNQPGHHKLRPLGRPQQHKPRPLSAQITQAPPLCRPKKHEPRLSAARTERGCGQSAAAAPGAAASLQSGARSGAGAPLHLLPP